MGGGTTCSRLQKNSIALVGCMFTPEKRSVMITLIFLFKHKYNEKIMNSRTTVNSTVPGQ